MVRSKTKEHEESKVVNAFQPLAPTFGVYYDVATDNLFTKPVLCFVAREHMNKKADLLSEVKLYPICLDQDPTKMIEECGEAGTVGFLGLCSEPEAKKATWQDKIRDLKKRMKNAE
jgi:hypothetical protein